jgi:hypothetical protein
MNNSPVNMNGDPYAKAALFGGNTELPTSAANDKKAWTGLHS